MAKPNGTKSCAAVTVEWGYESHTLKLSTHDWTKIKSGQALRIKGTGYDYEGDTFADHWDFGGGLDGHLRVEYGEDGAVGFDGVLSQADIEEV